MVPHALGSMKDRVPHSIVYVYMENAHDFSIAVHAVSMMLAHLHLSAHSIIACIDAIKQTLVLEVWCHVASWRSHIVCQLGSYPKHPSSMEGEPPYIRVAKLGAEAGVGCKSLLHCQLLLGRCYRHIIEPVAHLMGPIYVELLRTLWWFFD